jgi:hypothetical protein
MARKKKREVRVEATPRVVWFAGRKVSCLPGAHLYDDRQQVLYVVPETGSHAIADENWRQGQPVPSDAMYLTQLR